MSLLLCLQKLKNADFTLSPNSHLRMVWVVKLQSAHRLNLRPRAWLLPTEHELAPALHQSFKLKSLRPKFCKPLFVTSHGLAAIFALLSLCNSRPMHQDPRVLAHNERVVGNGFHAASSTRTSLGVFALQGLPSLTLRRISPVAPFTRLAVPLRPWLTSQGIHRWAIRQCIPLILTNRGFRPLLTELPLPPELCALVQLPVLQWLSPLARFFCTLIDPVARSFHVAVRSTLPSRRPPRLSLLCRSCNLHLPIPLLFSYHLTQFRLPSCDVLLSCALLAVSTVILNPVLPGFGFLAQRSVLLSGRW